MKRIKEIIEKNQGLDFVVHIQNKQELDDLITVLENLEFEAALPYELINYENLRQFMESCGKDYQYDLCFRISEHKGIAQNPSVEHFRRWYNDILEIRNGEIEFNERDNYTLDTAKIEAKKIWNEINEEDDSGFVDTLAIYGFSRKMSEEEIIQWLMQKGGKMQGKVKWFNAKKGYGFLIMEDSTEIFEIFVHYSGLNMEGFKSLKPGQTVTFDVIETERGRQAVNVTVMEDEGKED